MKMITKIELLKEEKLLCKLIKDVYLTSNISGMRNLPDKDLLVEMFIYSFFNKCLNLDCKSWEDRWSSRVVNEVYAKFDRKKISFSNYRKKLEKMLFVKISETYDFVHLYYANDKLIDVEYDILWGLPKDKKRVVFALIIEIDKEAVEEFISSLGEYSGNTQGSKTC